jgi:hypothetical protein
MRAESELACGIPVPHDDKPGANAELWSRQTLLTTPGCEVMRGPHGISSLRSSGPWKSSLCDAPGTESVDVPIPLDFDNLWQRPYSLGAINASPVKHRQSVRARESAAFNSHQLHGGAQPQWRTAMSYIDRAVSRRVGAAVVIAGVMVAAMTVVAGGAWAARGTSSAAPCLVREVFQGSAQSQRLALHGKVSCAQARRTYQRFLRDEYSGACGSGRICDIKQPGGWQCSFLSAVESQMDHGLQAGCRRAGASFGVYNVGAKASQATRARRATPGASR